jgi:CheY-like chemotaxis protein
MDNNQCEASFEAELKDVFLTEASEMLDDTEDAFIQIEENPQDLTRIDKIFRLIHTIKGSAHVAGFRSLGAFAHCFESLLGELRSGTIPVDTDVVDVLLAGNDRIRLFVSELRENYEAQVAVEDIENKIRAILGKKSPGSAAFHPTSATRPAIKDLSSAAANPSVEKLTLEATPGTISNSPAENKAKSKLTVLICDDEPDLLSMMAEMVEDLGYNVIACSNAVDALKAMQGMRIDVVMTDFSMPGMDGIQFIRKIRSFNQFIPVVVVSGHSSRDHFKIFLEIGVDEFIDKPFSEEVLSAVLQRVEKSQALREALLSISRLTFRAVVSLEKMEFLVTNSNTTDEITAEQQRFSAVLGDLRGLTLQLLDAERAHKKGGG